MLLAQRDLFMAHATAKTTRTTVSASHQADISTQATPSESERGDHRADAAAAGKDRSAPIPQGAMQDAAYARNCWRVVYDADRTSYDGVLTDVAVWGPNEAKLRAGDLVEVVDEQSTVFALLYLVDHVPAKSIRFAELIKAPLGGVAVGQAEARGHHYAQWRGPAKRWCIIGPTGTLVRDCILTKEEAERDVMTRNMPTSMAFVSHPRM
jgi:hypothetical protein